MAESAMAIDSAAADNIQRQLADLVARLKDAFGDRLISVILYGSAAVGDLHRHGSDLNVLCVLSRISAQELASSEPIFRWWREQRNPPPLLLTEEEVRTSTDCFPMEFHDMQEHRRVLHGADPIAGLHIDRSFYRAQVEHELRAKQIRLRQRGAEALANSEALSNLMIDSVSTFCVLGRHALMLAGHEPRWKKKEIAAALERVLNRPLKAINEILAIRASGKGNSRMHTLALFEAYLDETEALVRFVDGLER
jgi:predicted nucleotidyltransferase